MVFSKNNSTITKLNWYKLEVFRKFCISFRKLMFPVIFQNMEMKEKRKKENINIILLFDLSKYKESARLLKACIKYEFIR